MYWRIINIYSYTFQILLRQNKPSSGSSLNESFSADWANVAVAIGSAFIALVSLGFTIWTYNRQEEKNRNAIAEQREKDRSAEEKQKLRDQIAEQKQKERDHLDRLELERIRRQTIRLEWYQETVKPGLIDARRAFKELELMKIKIRTADLQEDEKDRLSREYRQAISYLPDKLLDPILLIHTPTYRKLRDELDKLIVEIDNALFNDTLKLSHPGVYEQEIGEKIELCQQRFFQVIYAYQGEE